MATLENLQNEFKKLIENDGIPEEYITFETPKEVVIKTLVNELAYTVQGFLDWYFDRTDDRHERISTSATDTGSDTGSDTKRKKGVKNISVLKTLVTEVVEEELRDARAAREPLPDPLFEEEIVSDLVGLVVNWQDWYLDYKVALDRDGWLESRGLTEEIYLEDSYGDEDKSEGLAYGLFEDEDRPYPRRDQQGYII